MAPSVEIPPDLHDEIQNRVSESDFDSVASYVEFVLTEVVSADPEIGGRSRRTERREEVQNRLESLGYIE